MKKLMAVAAIAACSVSAASASTLVPGDNVSLTYSGPFNSVVSSAVVGAGEDGNFFSNQFYDLNAGSAGDIFSIRSASNYCGIFSCGGAQVSLTLSDLDFLTPLTGITFLTNTVNAVATILSPTSIQFTWTETSLSPATYLEVQFSNVAPVPVPASGLLLMAAVGGIAALRRRRQQVA